MIKKYFALSIIAASVAVVGCSSDDEPAATTPTDPMTPAPPTATPGEGGTAFDTIVNSEAHTSLEAAIIAAGLADTLDDPAAQFTIFAPDDAAFAALNTEENPDTVANLLADVPALTRVLMYHVVSGTVDSTAVGTLITDNGGEPVSVDTLLVDGDTAQTVTLASSETAPFGVTVNDVDITAVDQGPDADGIGLVHVIGSVLTPAAAPIVEPPVTEPPVTEPPTGEAGPVLTAMNADPAGFTKVIAALGGNTIKLDEDDSSQDPWTIFAPTDAALGAADITLSDMVFVGPRQTPADLLADADGMITTFDGSATYAIGGTDEASLTIGGAPATLLGGGTSITYSLSAVPVAN